MTERLVRQYQKSTRLKGLIDGINQLIQDQIIDPVNQIADNLNVLTAQEIWLDRIGERLKLGRPFVNDTSIQRFGFDDAGAGFDQEPFNSINLGGETGVSDDIYRALLIARGMQLITDGSITSVDEVLQIAFGSGHYIDNQNLTVSVRFDRVFDLNGITILLNTGLLTKPAGVRILRVFSTYADGAFGFDDAGVGFDQTPFAQEILNNAT